MNYYNRIYNLNLPDSDKDGYSWLLANWDAVKKVIKKTNNIGATQRAIFKEIGFAPAPLFSFKHLFISKEYYIKQLEDTFLN